MTSKSERVMVSNFFGRLSHLDNYTKRYSKSNIRPSLQHRSFIVQQAGILTFLYNGIASNKFQARRILYSICAKQLNFFTIRCCFGGNSIFHGYYRWYPFQIGYSDTQMVVGASCPKEQCDTIPWSSHHKKSFLVKGGCGNLISCPKSMLLNYVVEFEIK